MGLEDTSPGEITFGTIGLVVLYIWPAIWTFRWRRWGWFTAVLLTFGIAGWLWIIAGWRTGRENRDADESANVAAAG